MQNEANAKSFTLIVTDRSGTETKFSFDTKKKTVGEALLEEKVIEGEKGPYGIYITKVNGVEATFGTDRTYWALYINGERATTGIDGVDVVDGALYALKFESK